MPVFGSNVAGLYASLIVAALTIAALVLGQDVLVPLAIAMCLSFVLAPIVKWMSIHSVPRSVAVVGVLLIVVCSSLSLFGAFSAQVVQLAGDLGKYQSNLVEKVQTVTRSTQGSGPIKRAVDAVNSISRKISDELGVDKRLGSPSETRAGPDGPAPAVVTVYDQSSSFLGHLGAALTPLTMIGLTFLFTLFMLLQSQDLLDRVVRVVGVDNLSGTTAALEDAADRLSQVFLTQAAMNAGFGIFVGFAMWMIGVPQPMLWGGTAMVMRFIPFIGTFIAAVPPVMLAAAVEPGWSKALLTLAVFGVGEPFMAQVVEPVLLGAKAGLSPFAMLVSASFWGLVWGPVGLILAAPMTLTLVVLGRYVRGLELFSILLGDEPALTPVQQFYQRLLAADPLAAFQQVETACEDCTPVEIVDTVVLPALCLGAVDYDNGRIDRERVVQVRETSADVVGQLYEASATEHAADPAPGHAKARVLVIGARTQIDLAVADVVTKALTVTPSIEAWVLKSVTGLTALAEARATNDPVAAVVLVSSGGSEAQYLPVLARRAARTFPNVQLILFDASGVMSTAPPSTPPQTLVYTKFADMAVHLAHLREVDIKLAS